MKTLQRMTTTSAILALIVSFVGAVVFSPATSAAPVTGFNAGRIIDDSVFTDKNSMTPASIQNFLNSKVPNCDTNGVQQSEFGGGTRAQYGASKNNPAPFTCLKDYSENGKSAAQIIYDVGQEFSINPQVIIVLLQKEQALVTDTWPFQVQYRTATGYGCPDTAACDSQYFGLTNQIRWSARMFRAILNNSPTWYTPYVLGNNFIQWSPTASCGGSTVNIQNRSTQALYNYTPYQPNQAALNTEYGTGDGCSAYGNRNFYQYFKDWFGSTNGPEYSAMFTSQALYSDAARTTPLPKANDQYIVPPSATVYATVTALNNGRKNWDSSTSLGTASPIDRRSALQDNSWLTPQRVTKATAGTVAPANSGIFNFTLKTPSTGGTYSESFGVVQDGVMWTNDTTTFNIRSSTSVTAPVGYTGHILGTTKTTIKPGETLLSPDTYTTLTLTNDGILELRRDFALVWATPKAGQGALVVMQADGNLVLYSKDMVAIWNSGTAGKGASTLNVQADGNLVLYGPQGYTWASGTAYATSHLNFANGTLPAEGLLRSGQTLQSADRKYTVYLQGDGNLVLYSNSSAGMKAVWASWTVGTGASQLIMQADGNLVLYTDSFKPVWSTGTGNKGSSYFKMQEDGNLVLYGPSGYSWASWTVGK